MFRRQPIILREQRTEYVTRNVNVTEKRAPTDESVRLLREMEDAAEKEIIKAVRVGDTMIECVVHQNFSVIDDLIELRAVFSLNGIQKTAKHAVNAHKAEDDPQIVWDGLRNEVAKIIASEMIADAFNASLRSGR